MRESKSPTRVSTAPTRWLVTLSCEPVIASVLPAPMRPSATLTMRRGAGPSVPLPPPTETTLASSARDPAPSATELAPDAPALLPSASAPLPIAIALAPTALLRAPLALAAAPMAVASLPLALAVPLPVALR
ncbi:hypothetical protein G6F56_014153 [Rhizopus delemar]|nr:hypothetical protein G6F56_014153 [Rhizopus delemar]